MQVQGYLHHGEFQSCLMIYVARDTGKVWMKEVFQVRAIGKTLEEKAKRILSAYDEILLKKILIILLIVIINFYIFVTNNACVRGRRLRHPLTAA